ncbi:MAG: IMPACT family protein [Lachnospiraceae bacterium]|nr:IMPACT family protein [Lachnospiraceae bacterium]
MVESYRTILVPGQGEIIEKKSRFIGEVFPAESLAEAEERLLRIRKRYYDARHHCFAAVVGEPGTPDELRRGNDDGEPGGTAGKPMLEVLGGEGLHKTAVVVTRYFGGTLLGTGGLVRAYSGAVKAAIENAKIATVICGRKIRLKVSYSDAGKLAYLYAREGMGQAEAEYGQDVILTLSLASALADRAVKMTMDATSGSAVLLSDEAGCFVQEE